MRIARFLLIFAAALVAVILLNLNAAKDPNAFEFQVEIAPSVSGRTQIYYDIGRGFNEEDSASVPVYPSSERSTQHFPLPPGKYRALRFDPIDGPGTVSFAHARIATVNGSVIRAIGPQQFQPNEQIAAVDVAGEVATVHPGANVNDPFFTIDFAPRINLNYSWGRQLWDSWAGLLKGGLVLSAFVWLLLLAWRERIRLQAWAEHRPRCALLLVAAIGAAAASYPVVFFGKSFVSPNVGSALLHASAPTVPGYTDLRTQDVRGADVGAMMWQHLPYSTVQARALFHGEWPLWNRYNSAGITLLGQGQSMFGDPIHLFVVLAGGASWAWDLKFLLAKTLFAAALALCVFQLTGRLSAAALIAIAAPFIGFFNYRINHPAIFSVCYAPWILYGWFCLSAASGRRPLAWALGLWTLANVSVLGSGTVKEAYMLAISLNLTGALLWLLTPAPEGASKWRRILLIAATGISCILLTTPLWLTFFDALKTAYTSYTVPQAWQIPRAWFIGLFDDLFYRELTEHHVVYVPASNLLFLLGIGWVLVQPRRLRQAPGAIALLIGGVAAVSVAFQFVPTAWILALPMLRNVYHVNNIFSAVAIVHAIVLAGWGLATARERLGEPHAWRPVAIIASLVAALLVIYFHDIPSHWLDGAGIEGWTRRASGQLFFYVNLALMLAALALFTFLTARSARRPMTGGAAALTALALGVLLYRHGQHLPMTWGREFMNTPAVRASLTEPSAAVEFVRRDSAAPSRVVGLDNDLFPGFASVYGLEGINGPDAIMNAPFRELAEAAGFNEGADWRFLFETKSLTARRPVLELLGVRYLLGSAPAVDAASGYHKIGSFDLEVYRDDAAWPRAFFTDRLGTYGTPADFVAHVRKADPLPFAETQAADGPIAPSLSADLSGRAVKAATDYRLTPNATQFVVDAPAPGVAVLTETFLPLDFRATVDGRPATYFRVNHAFKGVFLERGGRHEIVFTYWPRRFTFSLLMGAIGLLGLVAVISSLWFAERSFSHLSRPSP